MMYFSEIVDVSISAAASSRMICPFVIRKVNYASGIYFVFVSRNYVSILSLIYSSMTWYYICHIASPAVESVFDDFLFQF